MIINQKEWLQNRGIKVTPHKLAVLNVFSLYKHLNVNQISDSLKSNSVDISMATIYRILSSFERHNIIDKLNFGNDQAIYELKGACEHHDHLICTKCGNVTEFNHPQIEALQLEIARENNFQVLNHSLNIYGICVDCKND